MNTGEVNRAFWLVAWLFFLLSFSLSLKDQGPNFRASPIYGLFSHSVCFICVTEQWKIKRAEDTSKCPELIPDARQKKRPQAFLAEILYNLTAKGVPFPSLSSFSLS